MRKSIRNLMLCRDIFDIPPEGGRLENAWLAAMSDPDYVPDYVQACKDDFIRQLDDKDAEIKTLSEELARRIRQDNARK